MGGGAQEALAIAQAGADEGEAGDAGAPVGGKRVERAGGEDAERVVAAPAVPAIAVRAGGMDDGVAQQEGAGSEGEGREGGDPVETVAPLSIALAPVDDGGPAGGALDHAQCEGGLANLQGWFSSISNLATSSMPSPAFLEACSSRPAALEIPPSGNLSSRDASNVPPSPMARAIRVPRSMGPSGWVCCTLATRNCTVPPVLRGARNGHTEPQVGGSQWLGQVGKPASGIWVRGAQLEGKERAVLRLPDRVRPGGDHRRRGRRGNPVLELGPVWDLRLPVNDGGRERSLADRLGDDVRLDALAGGGFLDGERFGGRQGVLGQPVGHAGASGGATSSSCERLRVVSSSPSSRLRAPGGPVTRPSAS